MKGWGPDVTEKENIVDYFEVAHGECYGLDKDGNWHNGYWFNSKTALDTNPDFFLSRWEIGAESYGDYPTQLEQASDGKLLKYINMKTVNEKNITNSC